MSEQTFSISPTKSIDHSRLDAEIRASVSNYNGSQATYNGGGLASSLTVNSPSALSGSDQTTITNLITAHVASPIGMIKKYFSALLTTTNATTQTILSVPIPLSCNAYVDLVLMAASTGGVVSCWRKHGDVKRLLAGPLAVGTPTNFPGSPFQDAGASTWAQGFTISGNNLLLTVAGAAGVTISWNLSADVWVFNP